MRIRLATTLSFVRDSASNLTRIAAPSGRWMEFTYDASTGSRRRETTSREWLTTLTMQSGRLASVTNPMTGVQSFAYDASHRMTQSDGRERDCSFEE